MAEILPSPDGWDVTTAIVVIGGGACGIVAGLRALEAGADVLVLERDAVSSGSTALSSVRVKTLTPGLWLPSASSTPRRTDQSSSKRSTW